MASHLQPSPSFAQTGAELDLDDSDIDDLDLHAVAAGGNAAETYEMRTSNGTWETRRIGDDSYGGGSRALWDAEDEIPEDQDDDDDDDIEMHRFTPEGSSETGSSSVASFQLYTPDEEAAVRHKFDRKLVIFVALLYMLSFLDRSNIGNAYIAGMDADLKANSPARDDWYEWALSIFYVTYICFEWMSLLWRVVPAHIYVSMLVLSWGVLASLQAVAPSYPVLVLLRALLGIGEAGFTGVPFYLGFFYKRRELALRTAIFISAAPLATSFASSLAWVIVKFGEAGPIAPWRLLFLVEGFPSVIVSVIAWSVIPDSPQTARYLTRREKKVARLRLRGEAEDEAATKQKQDPQEPSRRDSVAEGGWRAKVRKVLSVLVDPVALVPASMFFLTNMAYSSLPVFLPKVLKDMGHSSLGAQGLSAPPYLVACVVVLLTARLSDRLGSRTLPLAVHAAVSAGGYAVLALAEPLRLPPWLRYLAVYPAAAGFFSVVTLLLVWSVNNQPRGDSRGAAAFALLQAVGQCGPLFGTRLYPDADRPYYTPGMRVCAIAMCGVTALAFLLRFILKRRNAALDAADGTLDEGSTPHEEEGLVAGGRQAGRRRGDAAAQFRYML